MAAHRIAVLIACKNGAETIANSVRSATEQADVYVISDGSDDATAEVAEAAGATVLERERSGGKPDALRAGNLAFDLASSYEYIAILDDDTILEPGYLNKLTGKMDADETIAAASGRIDSVWDHARRWNPLIAMRAFMYWSYQTTLKRGQNALRVVNVICGANTVFRADVFKQLIDDDAPYAIDDMYWLAEIVRRKLGRVAFVHDARSWTIDPHRLGDWYRQTVRWSWGQFQSVRGHRLGVPIQRDSRRRHGWGFSWFDAAYLALLIDWFAYAVEPLVIVPLAWWLGRWFDPLWFLVFYLGSSIAWISVAACALRKPRLVVLAPAILALDLLYRLTMLHAAIKAIYRPRVETCRWDSPERFLAPENWTAATPTWQEQLPGVVEVERQRRGPAVVIWGGDDPYPGFGPWRVHPVESAGLLRGERNCCLPRPEESWSEAGEYGEVGVKRDPFKTANAEWGKAVFRHTLLVEQHQSRW